VKRIAVAILAIGILAGVGAAAAGGRGTQARVTKFRELAKGGTYQYVDNPPHGVSIGDFAAFSSVLADRSGKHIGRIDVQCVITAGRTLAKAHQTCTGVLTLPGGQVTDAVGIVGAPTNAVIAVTGGTGAYAGARGTLTVVGRKGGGADDTLELVP
jgi:hypothetical protein